MKLHYRFWPEKETAITLYRGEGETIASLSIEAPTTEGQKVRATTPLQEKHVRYLIEELQELLGQSHNNDSTP